MSSSMLKSGSTVPESRRRFGAGVDEVNDEAADEVESRIERERRTRFFGFFGTLLGFFSISLGFSPIIPEHFSAPQ